MRVVVREDEEVAMTGNEEVAGREKEGVGAKNLNFVLYLEGFVGFILFPICV